jgi:hypothetical protein
MQLVLVLKRVYRYVWDIYDLPSVCTINTVV